MSKKKQIAILTSGGDAPGMNAVINSIIKKSKEYDYEVFLIFNGFKGLYNNEIKKNENDFTELVAKGGTAIYSSRFEDFKKEEIRKKAADNLKKNKIDVLICIGGNGTYAGAYELSKMGIKCICIPSTIDNDIVLTDFTIGFDTCLNTIVNCIDKIRDTTASHQKCSIVEVMGRDCGDLALYSGFAQYADITITPKNYLTINTIIEKISKIMQQNKNAIIIVSEKLYNVQELAKKIETSLKCKCSAEILGHLQRGGIPSAFDRVLAYKFGSECLRIINENNNINGCLGIKNNKIIYYDFKSIKNKIFKNKI